MIIKRRQLYPSFFLAISLFILLWCALPASKAHAQDNGTSTWSTFRGNAAHTGSTTLEGPPEEIDVKMRWRPYNDTSPISASPVIGSNEAIYAATEGGYLAQYGESGWIYNVSCPVQASPAVTSDGSVFAVCSDGYMYYLDAAGEVVWKCDYNTDILSSPVISGSTAYMGTDGGSLLAVTLDPDMSNVVSQSNKIYQADIELWSFVTLDKVRSSPAFSGNTLFFGSGDYLYAINPNAADNATEAAGTADMLKWKYDLDAEVLSSPAVYDDRVYVGADNGYLYALSENVDGDAQQGELIWKRKTGDKIRSSPAVSNVNGETYIYVGSDDGMLYAYDENGELEWTFATFGPIRSSPAVDVNGDIYFGSDDHYIYALYPDGSLKWKQVTFGMVRSSPAIGTGNLLYVGSDDGNLYCIGPGTQEDQEPDVTISVSMSLSAVENEGNPTTISAQITSPSEGQDVLSRIDAVTLDLSALGMFGLTVSDDFTDFQLGELTQVAMLDNGMFEDDVASDGIYTYAFGITNDSAFITFDPFSGIFTHYLPEDSAGVGPVPLMVTVTDLYGNKVSKAAALNISQKIQGTPTEPITFSVANRLHRQQLNVYFTSGTPSILSVMPNQGVPEQRLSITIVGSNTNFTKDRTRVEIFNDEGQRIAKALPEDDDVNVLSDTALTAVLSILSTDEVTQGTLIGRWDVVVTTEFIAGGEEIVVGEDMFEISGVAAKMEAMLHPPGGAATALRDTRQDQCEFTLDITNATGARAEGSPWRISSGYSRTMTIDNARSGVWNYSVSVGDCTPVPSFKIITTGSDFGYLVGEVRNALTGEGIDNATITVLSGEVPQTNGTSTVSAGGGYYMLPLAATEDSYTVIADKNGLVDIEDDIVITAGQETQQNFSLLLDSSCPVSMLVQDSSINLLRSVRDRVLAKSSFGRRWTRLYYLHAPEMQAMITDHPAVRRKIRQFIGRAVLDAGTLMTRGTIGTGLERHLDDIMRLIEKKAGPELKRALQNERTALFTFLKMLQ